jgi:hypothetical protein
MLACIVPTHRALGLEPTVALRTDQLENIGRGAEIRASGLPAPKAEVKADTDGCVDGGPAIFG